MYAAGFDNWIEHMTTMVFSFQQSWQIIDNVQQQITGNNR